MILEVKSNAFMTFRLKSLSWRAYFDIYRIVYSLYWFVVGTKKQVYIHKCIIDIKENKTVNKTLNSKACIYI